MSDNSRRPDLERMYKMRSASHSGSGGGSSRSGGICGLIALVGLGLVLVIGLSWWLS